MGPSPSWSAGRETGKTHLAAQHLVMSAATAGGGAINADAERRPSRAGDFDDDDDDVRATAAAAAASSATTSRPRLLRDEPNGALGIAYMSLFSIVGYALRAYAGRLFGGDCDLKSVGGAILDFLWPVSSRICVTANGKTVQYGGAIFVDLPANMLGCLVMGYFAGSRRGDCADVWPAMPCLSHQHPWQGEGSLHFGIRTGLCGSLTTFSSWNTQMVLMMDGAANPYLGSQVLAALFGYVLGLQTSLVSFRAGRTLGAWSHAGRNPHIFDAAVSKREMRPRRHHAHLFWMTPLVLFVAVGALVALFVLGDSYWGIPYYRELWIGSLLAPVGTLLRYKLATLNGKLAIRGEYWFPSGTFLANFFGSILSAAFTAWAFVQSQDEGAQSWEIPILNAVTLGAAGCLSTVSTYAKECVELGEKNPPYDKKQFLYSHGTILSCCLIGLLVYSPIVRFA